MLVLSSEKMQNADFHAINEIGIPSIVLMENACRGIVSIIKEYYPKEYFEQVIVVAGKGHNGGDGIGVARILAESGYDVELILLGRVESLKNEPLINFNIYKNLHYHYSVISGSKQFSLILDKYSKNKTIIVDAIFGTGINKPVKDGFYKEIIRYINKSQIKIIAIDIPSGLSEQFIPESEGVIYADTTVAVQALKEAHIFPDGNNYCGNISIIDIGVPLKSLLQSKPSLRILESDEFDFIKTERCPDAHKGDFGHCLNISGSNEKPGASILSSVAILKSGAGLCTTAVLPENRELIINALPELMIKPYLKSEDLIDSIKNSEVILFGPGMGTGDVSAKTLELVLSNTISPVVIDADGINIIVDNLNLLNINGNRKDIILTPHPGEFARLIKKSKKEIRANRISLASKFALSYKVFLILKGHHTIIASPDGNVYINQSGNAGMATAGSGDVLSGIITGFLAQFMNDVPVHRILAVSTFVHGYAGDLAREKNGELSMTASDIIKFLPTAIKEINDYKSKFKSY